MLSFNFDTFTFVIEVEKMLNSDLISVCRMRPGTQEEPINSSCYQNGLEPQYLECNTWIPACPQNPIRRSPAQKIFIILRYYLPIIYLTIPRSQVYSSLLAVILILQLLSPLPPRNLSFKKVNVT